MNKILKKYIVIILGIYLFWLGGVPLILSALIKTVAENITFNSPYDIDIKKPRIVTSPLPTLLLKAEQLDIKNKNSNEKLHIVNPRVKIRLLPLFSGHVHVNKISASEVEINSRLLKKPRLDKDFLYNLRKESVLCDAIKIAKINAELIQDDGNIEYKAHNLYFRKNGRYIRINIDSVINSQNISSQIKVKLYLPKNNDVKKSEMDVDILNLDINPIANFMRNYLPEDFSDAKGVIDINIDKNHMTSSFRNVAITMLDDAKSMLLPQNLKINSDFIITRKTIQINSADIESDNIHAGIVGTISNYLDKPLPSLNLSINLNKSRVEDFISMLPAFKTEDIDMYKLKKYKFYGDVIGNFSVKGDNLEPSVNGNVFINNGILTNPIPNTKGATVKLEFLGKYLNYDVFVPASLSEKVWVKGGVELYNVKYADMRVWSTEKVDLALAEEKVVPIHEILNFVIGPVPIMNIKGDGNIDITVKGNRKNPHVWGSLNLNNVTAYFNDIPNLILKNADAVLTFDDENAVFNMKRGEINGKKTDINGTCNLAGKFDFEAKSDGQEIGYLYNAIKTSENLVNEIKTILPQLDTKEGLIDFKIKVFGNIKDIAYVKFRENFFTSGEIKFLGNTFGINGIKINNTKGKVIFDGTNIESETTALIGGAPISAKILLKNNIADLNLDISKLNLSNIISVKDKIRDDLGNIITSVSLQYKGNYDGNAENIEYDKIKFSAKILGTENKNKLQISEGAINLKNGKLFVNNIKGKFPDTNSSFDINLNIDNISSKPLVNGNVKLHEFELPIINMLTGYPILPENLRETIKLIRFDKGKINLNASVRNNSINASTNLGGVELTYTPLMVPIKIVNGSIYIRKNFLGLNKINLLADEMPILLDGGINNLFTKQDFNLYINSKPKQEFIDKYVNNNKIYPIKIKGDIVYQAKLNGIKDNYDLVLSADLAKDSSVYYLGATIGDVENALLINLDMNVVRQNILKVKEFSYDKLISSLGTRKTRMNMLKASGGIDVYKDDLVFHDLHIKTQNPTDARIFNIIFRKPNIKQGQFTSDLKFNGKLSNPRLIGNFHIFETNIPFLDTSMKNISFRFKDKTIDISSVGEVLGNEIKFKGTLKNKLTVPYYVENAELFTKEIDLNYLADRLKISQVDSYQTPDTQLDLKGVIIKNLKMTSNSIRLRNLVAQDVEASASITENRMLNVNNFKFTIASGMLDGKFSYNLDNSNTVLDIKAKNIDANEITYAVFDLNNQLYGNLTGNMKLSCVGEDFNKCMNTLNGNTSFNVTNGRIPKLGSLEYLLKAGNLIKGGITNISINSVIDIITPLKTGEFTDIYGNMTIADGESKDIEISSKGKDLSLFIAGKYNFATSVADMEVLGLLSKKISTVFGPIGNVSLNTLFNVIPGVDLNKDSKILDNINKIPGIEISGKAYRKFIAEIKGNINGDDYVKSFKWIN